MRSGKERGYKVLPTISTQTQVMAAIEQERRIEFFAEWGHRWFDLKRWPARANDGKKANRRGHERLTAPIPGNLQLHFGQYRVMKEYAIAL